MIEKIKYQLFRQRHVREIYLLYLIVLMIFFFMIYTSLAIFEKNETISGVAIIESGNLLINVVSDNSDYNTNTGEITVEANSNVKLTLTLINNTPSRVRYKLYYLVNGSTTVPVGVTVGMPGTSDSEVLDKLGNIDNTIDKEIVILNNSSNDIVVKIWYDLGYGHNELSLDATKLALIPNTELPIPILLSEKIKENNSLQEVAPDFSKIAVSQEYYDTLPETSEDSTVITKANAVVENGLFRALDSDGETYYFRGHIENNYVRLNKMDILFRVVRINGDGTIRLALNDVIKNDENSVVKSAFSTVDISIPTFKRFGYSYDNANECSDSTPCDKSSGTPSDIKTLLEEWYINNLSKYNSIIAESRFCNAVGSNSTISYNSNSNIILVVAEPVVPTYFNSYNNIITNSSPNFMCSNNSSSYPSGYIGGEYKLKIGLLSADEISYAGLTYNVSNIKSYLNKNNDYLLMSPSHTGDNVNKYYMFSVNDTGSLINIAHPTDLMSILPVINLNADIPYTTGDGTKDNPYVVSIQ